jgi:hypothetical protein
VPLAADSQVFAMYAQTGTAATAGVAYVIIEYVCDNDLCKRGCAESGCITRARRLFLMSNRRGRLLILWL